MSLHYLFSLGMFLNKKKTPLLRGVLLILNR